MFFDLSGNLSPLPTDANFTMDNADRTIGGVAMINVNEAIISTVGLWRRYQCAGHRVVSAISINIFARHASVVEQFCRMP